MPRYFRVPINEPRNPFGVGEWQEPLMSLGELADIQEEVAGEVYEGQTLTMPDKWAEIADRIATGLDRIPETPISSVSWGGEDNLPHKIEIDDAITQKDFFKLFRPIIVDEATYTPFQCRDKMTLKEGEEYVKNVLVPLGNENLKKYQEAPVDWSPVPGQKIYFQCIYKGSKKIYPWSSGDRMAKYIESIAHQTFSGQPNPYYACVVQKWVGREPMTLHEACTKMANIMHREARRKKKRERKKKLGKAIAIWYAVGVVVAGSALVIALLGVGTLATAVGSLATSAAEGAGKKAEKAGGKIVEKVVEKEIIKTTAPTATPPPVLTSEPPYTPPFDPTQQPSETTAYSPMPIQPAGIPTKYLVYGAIGAAVLAIPLFILAIRR